MIARAAPFIHSGWLTSRTGTVASTEFRAIEAVDEHGKIYGMVGFDGWTENSVVATIALDAPIALRTLLRPACTFVFDQAGRGLMLALVMSTNKRSLDLCARIGLKPTYTIRDGISKGVDLILHEMRREDCMYLDRKAA